MKMVIDEIAYSSKLRNVSPFLKLFISLFSLAVCIFEKNIYINLFMLISVLIFMRAIGKTRWQHILQLMRIPMTFTLIGAIVLIFVVTKTPESMIIGFSIAGYTVGITEESIVQCVYIIVQCMAAFGYLIFISVTTPMPELLTALKKLRIPDFFVDMMGLVYRYIFVLIETAEQIKYAQECRLGYRDIKTSFYSAAQLISNLFIRTYKQAERTYTAMESRGYTGEIRTLDIVYNTPKQYIVGTIIYCICLLLFCAID